MTWALLVELRPVLAAGFGVAALLTLILRARMDAFLALILVSILSGIAAGLAPAEAFASITAGMGGTLGFIAVVIGLGALFGAILEATGGVSALAEAMVRGDAARGGRLRMGVLGLLVSTPVFFDVGLIILAPLVMAMGKRAGRPAMAFALPLLAGLAAAHAMIPPTPGPLAVAELLNADLSFVIAFGVVAGILAMLVGGPIYAALIERFGRMPSPEMAAAPAGPGGQAIDPPAGAAGKTAAIIGLPLVLILVGTLGENLLPEGALAREALVFIGHPFSALLVGCGAALLFLGGSSDAAKAKLKEGIARALEPTGAVILVTGAGGAFKQVLIDSGAGEQLASAAQGLGLAPIAAGFVLAGLMRVAQGSATVAMITAAGLLAPVSAAAGLSAPQVALVATAISSGAVILSHVNDSGFWLVSRLFGLSTRQTLQTWTVTSTLVGFTGFGAAAALYMWV